jgi:hypothetical protein
MDMEGIYVYRLDRIILFGGWNGIIKKAPRLQLARLRVDIGNSADHLLHLNVAKSKVIVPHDLVNAFEKYIEQLKVEAEREYFNRGLKKFSGSKTEKTRLFNRISTNKGTRLEVSKDYPLLQSLLADLNQDQSRKLKVLIRLVNTTVNKIRQNHEDRAFRGIEEEDGLSTRDLVMSVQDLVKSGVDVKTISKHVLPQLGYTPDSLPEEVLQLLQEG